VQAAPGAVTTKAPVQAVSAAAPKKGRPVLCATQLGKPAKPAPKADISRAGSTLPDEPQYGDGKWTWVNLWAAWCVPCKEEMPILKQWEQKLASERTPLRLTFVSLDDDERQLKSFLGPQAPGGLTGTYWLKDGKEREEWLKEAGFNGEPELPAHLLVDPAGNVRCKVQGAIEDRDFSELVKIVRGIRGGTGAGQAEGQAAHGHKP